MSALELMANAAMTVSILLAARNNVHTWWVGIVGCGLFAAVFLQARLYADVTLQAFFVATSIAGWLRWKPGGGTPEIPITRAGSVALALHACAGVLCAMAYGWLLHRYTDAYAPFIDSLVLSFSVAGQLLLMRRQLETWWFWLLVNVLSVPLYFSRELYLTAGLYAVYLVNAGYALRRWTTLLPEPPQERPA